MDNNISEVFEKSLKKYFSKQKNIDYILKKTTGPDQSLKIYELLCIINNPQNQKEDKLEQAIIYLKKNHLLWSHPTFDKEKKKIEEENDFMVCPYEISEGVLVCGKCRCKKIFSFSKQTRSMDEPMTVFGLCSQCGHKWCEGS
jgi:DNA-directed RNA polymerase subunit M/transcription elongation factor TFIIS